MKKIFLLSIAFIALCFGDILDEINKAYENEDYKKAYDLSNKACEMNNATACSNLAVLYEYGQGVKQNFQKASELYSKACKMNDIAACYSLGSLYVRGKGVKQNFKQAKEYYGKACDLGAKKGCDAYKILNQKGY